MRLLGYDFVCFSLADKIHVVKRVTAIVIQTLPCLAVVTFDDLLDASVLVRD